MDHTRFTCLPGTYIGNAPSVQGCGGNGRPSGAEALSFTDADIGMIT